jgi:hypothetical protein
LKPSNVRRASQVFTWGLAPLLVALLAAGVGRWHASAGRGASASSADRPAQPTLESMPSLAVANATWALGSVEAVRKMARTEIDRLPQSEAALRSQVFLRFGIIDTNPDGQAALFSQACASDATICDQPKFKEAAARQTKTRFVAPGNMLPLSLMGGHPPINGRDLNGRDVRNAQR